MERGDQTSGARGTDSIPRAAVEQILHVVTLLDSKGTSTFDDVRQLLHLRSARSAPASREAMWTVARDVLSDLQRLGYATVGALPRKRSEVERLRESPCELTATGRALAGLLAERQGRGRAFDQLLVVWMNEHPYFRQFMARLLSGPLYIPDVTTVKQVGSPTADASLAERVIASCSTRLAATVYPEAKLERFAAAIHERVMQVESRASLSDLNAKKLIDAIEDLIVIPAFLLAEELPFDAVTFQHLIRISQDFLSAAWTSSYPVFEGRVVFATCEFRPALHGGTRAEGVVHHGRTYAAPLFKEALRAAHQRLADSQGAYVDAYALRALVCVQLGIQPIVFAHCLDEIIRAGQSSGMVIFTELPFAPPPPGESYVEIGNRRIGLIKVVVAANGE
ncbi:hypothetical protein [Pyxidicoccus caerfyrddinensis]|uniref:hypothetical protein n=1 Tax=Pyxidicoccus caerfyrddinensis TaxID=2709663 RepID=UPI0013D91BEE|nr:hypothetical protein [Pyxidicoccus caerfyrddinensis]